MLTEFLQGERAGITRSHLLLEQASQALRFFAMHGKLATIYAPPRAPVLVLNVESESIKEKLPWANRAP